MASRNISYEKTPNEKLRQYEFSYTSLSSSVKVFKP